MNFKLNKTSAAVIAFVIIALLALYAAESEADFSVKLGLGNTVINSGSTTGEISAQLGDWEVAFGLIGAGHTERGEQENVNVYSVSRVIAPDWEFLGGKNYYRMGVAYLDDSPLVPGGGPGVSSLFV